MPSGVQNHPEGRAIHAYVDQNLAKLGCGVRGWKAVHLQRNLSDLSQAMRKPAGNIPDLDPSDDHMLNSSNRTFKILEFYGT